MIISVARESSLWTRLSGTGVPALRARGHRVDLQRVENVAVSGHPDVEGCIDGAQVWIELKSNLRPKRAGTPIRPKCRESQSIWHKQRAAAGCNYAWILLQVGEHHNARLYLVPGNLYDHITAPESILEILSVCDPAISPADVLLRAVQGYAVEPWQ